MTEGMLLLLSREASSGMSGVGCEEAYCQAAPSVSQCTAAISTYYMNRAHSITTPCTCVNNTSCNQPKVVSEPEIPAPRVKEWQSGMGTLKLLVVW